MHRIEIEVESLNHSTDIQRIEIVLNFDPHRSQRRLNFRGKSPDQPDFSDWI